MKPVPQQVVDRAQRLSRVHGMHVAAQIIGIHPSLIYRMRDRGWKAGDKSKRPVPNDFAIQALHMTHRELCEHYRASATTVTKWFREKPVRPHWQPGAPPKGVRRFRRAG